MTEVQILEICRQYLFDLNGEIYSDDELNAYVSNAVKAYSEDTLLYRRHTDFFPDENYRYHYPKDFIRFVACYNEYDQRVHFSVKPPVLPDGTVPEYVYDESEQYGEYGLSPDCSQRQAPVQCHFYGNSFGILETKGENGASRFYGVVLTGDYGCTGETTTYEYVGDYLYARYADIEEIFDYNALVYHVCYEAYNGDGEWSNTDMGKFYKALYDARVARAIQTSYRDSGRSGHGNFY